MLAATQPASRVSLVASGCSCEALDSAGVVGSMVGVGCELGADSEGRSDPGGQETHTDGGSTEMIR